MIGVTLLHRSDMGSQRDWRFLRMRTPAGVEPVPPRPNQDKATTPESPGSRPGCLRHDEAKREVDVAPAFRAGMAPCSTEKKSIGEPSFLVFAAAILAAFDFAFFIWKYSKRQLRAELVLLRTDRRVFQGGRGRLAPGSEDESRSCPAETCICHAGFVCLFKVCINSRGDVILI